MRDTARMPSSLWRHRDFQKLWVGQTISEIGSRVTREGIPITAVMLLKATPLQMGALASLTGFAALFAGVAAGHVADRYFRRPILIAADVGRAFMLATVPLAAALGRLSFAQLYVVVFAAGVMTIFFDVAYQSFLPSMVREDQLLEGNSKLAVSAATAEVLGPGITGVLVQMLGAPRAILLDSVSFLVSAVSILLIRTPEHLPREHEQEPGLSDVMAGLRYVAQHPILRALALRTVTMMFFAGFFSTLYVIYAIRDLGLTPVMLGFVVALGGAGNLFGASISHRLSGKIPFGWILIGASAISGTMALLIPLAHGTAWLAASYLGAAQLFGDVAYPVYNVHELTLRQRLTPAAILGRVNASMQLAFKGAWPFGALVGGGLAVLIGSRATVALSAAGVLLSTLWLIASPLRALRALPPLDAIRVRSV